MRRKMLLVTKHSQLGSWHAIYWVCMARLTVFFFCSLQGLNLSIFSLSTGVEKDAIEEDQAFGHVGKISDSHLAM